VQVWVSSADVMPVDRARRFQRYGSMGRMRGRAFGSATFVDIYGMVELSGGAAVRLYAPSVTSTPVAALLRGQAARHAGACRRRGRQPGGRRSRGRAAVPRRRRAAWLRGPRRRRDRTNGWFSSGDHGRVWPGGVFQFVGRAKDRLKVGGFSVFPAEVEHELREAPGLRDVALVGVPDDRLGERPVAVVVPDADFDPEAFLAWSKEHVAGYRRPTQVVETDELPRGNHGKIDRVTATDIAVEQLERAR
jgi:acyl-coenzyme A synthetase/AMP-(fatty) acid ligase